MHRLSCTSRHSPGGRLDPDLGIFREKTLLLNFVPVDNSGSLMSLVDGPAQNYGLKLFLTGRSALASLIYLIRN
jgi:hypothetical protein